MSEICLQQQISDLWIPLFWSSRTNETLEKQGSPEDSVKALEVDWRSCSCINPANEFTTTNKSYDKDKGSKNSVNAYKACPAVSGWM